MNSKGFPQLYLTWLLDLKVILSRISSLTQILMISLQSKLRSLQIIWRQNASSFKNGFLQTLVNSSLSINKTSNHLQRMLSFKNRHSRNKMSSISFLWPNILLKSSISPISRRNMKIHSNFRVNLKIKKKQNSQKLRNMLIKIWMSQYLRLQRSRESLSSQLFQIWNQLLSSACSIELPEMDGILTIFTAIATTKGQL